MAKLGAPAKIQRNTVETIIREDLKVSHIDNQIDIKLYEPHANQIKIIQDPARFKVIRCGRRFGKTMFAVNTLFISALLKENGTFWYVAPTYRQAKQIAWRMFLDIYRANDRKLFFKAPVENLLQIQLHNGSYIELKGADNEDSLRGVGLDGVVLDEYAMIKHNVWDEIIQPTLADRLGWAIFISTPKGYNHFYELYAKAEHTKDWSAFHFTSYDNPTIRKEEIDRARETMNEDYFAQEYLADFKKFTGLVYKDFNRDVHSIMPFQIPAHWNKWRTIDAGFTNPFVCLWIAEDPNTNEFYVYDEHYVAGQTTKYHAEIINGKSFGQYYRQTFIDPAAAQIMQDLATFQIYCSKAVNTVQSTKGNQITSGISKVSEMLKINPTTQRPRLFIFNHCQSIIKEFETYHWSEKKSGHNDREVPHKEADHAMDALRYFFNSYNTLQTPKIKKDKPVYKPHNSYTGY